MGFWDSYQQSAPAPQPQQQGPGGLLGFVQGIGKSVGNDINTVGNAFGSGINFFANQLNGTNAQRQQDIVNNTLKAQKLQQEANTTGILAPGQPAKLQQQITGLKNINTSLTNQQQAQQQDVQQNNNPLKVGAAGASLLMDTTGLGAGGGLLAGGLKQAIGQGIKQGALYGTAQGALQPIKDTGNINLSDIGGGAATGAASGALFGGAAGAAGGLLSKIGALGKNAAADTGAASAASTGNKVQNFLNDKGTQMQARAGGYGVGEGQGGKSLGFFDSAQMNQNLANEGIKAGSPAARLKATETALNQRGQQLDDAVSQNNLPVSQADKHQIASDFMNQLETTPGVTDQAKNLAEQHINTLLKAGNDTKALVDFKRGLDTNAINYNANPDAATSANQLASTVLRGTLKDAINSRVPTLQPLNDSYHNLSDAAGFLKSASKKISNQSESAGGGIAGRLLTNETAQAVKSQAGGLLQKISGQPSPSLATAPEITSVSPSTPPSAPAETPQVAQAPALPTGLKETVQAAKSILPAAQARGLLGSIAVPSAARAAAIAPQVAQQDQQIANPQPPSDQSASNLDVSSLPSDNSGNIFSQGNIQNLVLQDLQRNGGKNVSSLIALYNAFGKGNDNLTTNQKNEVVSQQKALDSLKVYTDRLASAGGGSGPLLGALQSSVLGNYIAPQAKALDAQRIDIASAIAGSLNPRGTVSPTTARLIADALPTISDTPEVAQAKIDGLVRQIKSGTFSADTSVPQLQQQALASQ